MNIVKRKTIDRDEEKRIISYLITSDKLLTTFNHIMRPEIFELAICKKICTWITDYFEIYKQAPKEHIQDIYNQKKLELKESDVEEVEDFLVYLSDNHSDEITNIDYISDKIKVFITARTLILKVNKIQEFIEAGKIDDALNAYYKSDMAVSDLESGWDKPLDDTKYVTEVFDYNSESLLDLHGKLGEMIGPLKRGFLFGITGPFKRGKSWFVQELCYQAITSKLKTLVISLEMKSKHLSYRFYSQLGVFGKEETSYNFPVFDCVFNQDNTCSRKERSCHVPITESSKYLPCTWCRLYDPSNYRISVWSIVRQRPGISRQKTMEVIKQFNNTFGRNLLRMKSYPCYSASLNDILRDIEILELKENFVADVIMIDYPDILATDNKKLDKRDSVDLTWRTLKGVSSERECLVIVPTQSNRAGLSKDVLEEVDTSEDIRKLAHVDIMAWIHQTEEEKKLGMMRVGIMEHRWNEFNRKKYVLVLQQLLVGQPNLDSEITTGNLIGS